jgi:bifunctional DNA-binding transcriptional regulator/antitoxin component of YhaV-PrlF toxin-antitoxin module
MKLQKQLSRKVGDRAYPKYVIIVPPQDIEALGWKEGEYLESEINDQMLIVRREEAQKIEKRREAAKKAWEKRKKGR